MRRAGSSASSQEGSPISARRVELDYLRPARRIAWPGLALLALSLGLAAWLGVQYDEVRAELGRLQAASGALPERKPAAPLPKGRLDEQAKSAEAVVRELTLPWAALMSAIERSASREVVLLQLQPDAQSRTLKLTAEARSRDAMFAYVRSLAASGAVVEAHIVNHQVQKDDPQRPIQFALQATLKATP